MPEGSRCRSRRGGALRRKVCRYRHRRNGLRCRIVAAIGPRRPQLLGCAVIAESFERIHRSNLIGMGVLPLQFPTASPLDTRSTAASASTSWACNALSPRRRASSRAMATRTIKLLVRLDSPREIDCTPAALPLALRSLVDAPSARSAISPQRSSSEAARVEQRREPTRSFNSRTTRGRSDTSASPARRPVRGSSP